MALKNLEREYVLGDLELYREFDNSHFISNAKMAVTGKVQAVNLRMKFDYYSNMLGKAIADFSAINIEKDSITEFLTHFDSIDRLDSIGLTVCDIDQCDVTTFKPQYIAQYTNMVQVLIDKVIQGSITDEEVTRIITGDLPEKVERQVVRTTMRYGVSPKELVGTCCNKVKADTTYVKTKVIPFIASYQQLKDTVIIEANSLLNAIKESEDSMKAMHLAIEKIKNEGKLDFEKVRQLNQISYNALRGMIDIISYVTFMMVRKMNSISEKAISCEKLYNDVTNLYADVDMIESGLDNNVLSNDTNSLAEGLLNGNADAYSVFAKNIYDFYEKIPITNIVSDTPSYSISDSEKFISTGHKDEMPKMLDTFEDIAKAYLSISTGLDIIGEEGGEFLLVFDNIIQRSGFDMPIDVRFKTDISNIKDMSGYNINHMSLGHDLQDLDMFRRALTEVKSYGDNMQSLANIIAEVYKKIKVLSGRFARNVNGEYSDTETVNELKVFLANLLENYEEMTRTVSRNFYDRLKSIGQVLSALNNNDKIKSVDNYATPLITDSSYTIADDFTEMAFESILNDYEEESNTIFRALESSYYIEKEKAYRGVNVILEADQPAQQATTTTTSTATSGTASTDTSSTTSTGTNTTGTTNNTAVSVQDNSANTSSGGALSKLKADITAFINTIIEKFSSMVRKSSNKNNTWLAENKDELLNRSYSNVTVNILPYRNMPAKKIVEDIGKLSTAVKSMTPQNLQNIGDKNALYSRLFAFIQGGVNESNGSLSDQIKKYYKVGTAELQTVPISNSELKTEIQTVIIPFCEEYSTKFQSSVVSALQAMGTAVDDTIRSYGGGQSSGTGSNTSGTQPVKESVSIFMEADNTEGSISTKANWMREATKVFSGAILNAIRDRNQDYLKVLSSLTPKTPVRPFKKKNNNQNSTDNTATTDTNNATTDNTTQTTDQQTTQPAQV